MNADVTGSATPILAPSLSLGLPLREFSDTTNSTSLATMSSMYAETTSGSISWKEKALTNTSKGPRTSGQPPVRQHRACPRPAGRSPAGRRCVDPLAEELAQVVGGRRVEQGWDVEVDVADVRPAAHEELTQHAEAAAELEDARRALLDVAGERRHAEHVVQVGAGPAVALAPSAGTDSGWLPTGSRRSAQPDRPVAVVPGQASGIEVPARGRSARPACCARPARRSAG